MDYSLCVEKIKGKIKKGLSTSVIYGPNASGKTNLISAMDVLRTIVLRGNIKNAEELLTPNPAAASLELIPNNQMSEERPVGFSIEFTEEGMCIRYDLCIRLGTFMDIDAKRRIVRETLTVNGNILFERADDLVVGNLKTIFGYLGESDGQKTDSLMDIAKRSLNPEELFLTNGFKLYFLLILLS